MKEKPKKLMNTIFLLLAINSVSMAKEVKEENEFIILGTEYKMSDKNKKLKKLSDTNNEKPENLSDDTEGSDEPSDDSADTKGSDNETEKITVIKENGVVKAEKTALGSSLSYETTGNILGNDNTGLWAADNNTSVANKYIIESYYTNNEAKNFSAEIVKNANFINEGTIGGNRGGVLLQSGAVMSNEGTINNTGDYGIYLEDSGTVLNNYSAGKIENDGNYGIFLNEGTKAENNGIIANKGKFGIYINNGEAVNSGVIENNNDFGIYALGSESVIENNGTVKNTGNYGLYAGNEAKTANNAEGIIENTGDYGIYTEGNKSIAENFGIVSNEKAYGMIAKNGGTIVNTKDGIVNNGTDYGMYVDGTGSTAQNNGKIKNDGNSGIHAVSGSEGINSETGIIQNTGNVGMYSESGSKTLNYGRIENSGLYGMFTADNSQGYNYGEIKNNSSNGAYVTGSGSVFINEETGIISNNGKDGIHISSSAEGINKGIIANNGTEGMYVESQGQGRNFGEIRNTSDNGVYINGAGSRFVNEETGVISNAGTGGIYATFGGTVENKGVISNNGKTGVFITNNSRGYNYGEISNTSGYGAYVIDAGSVFINEETGIISNAGSIGIYVLEGGRAENKGLISNTDTDGMYIASEGQGYNYGEIRNSSDNGVYITGTGSIFVNKETGIIANEGNYGIYSKMLYSGIQPIVINDGTIHLTGDNKTGVYINNTNFTNNGIIRIDGENATGIKAENNSTVRIGQNSQIILDGNSPVTQTNTDYEDTASTGANNSNSGGRAYVLDSTSTLVNAGTITSSGKFTVESEGKFVLDTQTGEIEASTLNLEGDMYLNAEGTLDSSEDSYLLKSVKVNDVTGTGSIVSDSYLFTASAEKDEDNYSMVMKRKDFSDVFSGDLGEVLENNYSGSENNNVQNALYNSLKKNVTSEALAKTAQEEITGESITANLTYQQLQQNKILEDGIFQLLDKKSDVNQGFYLNFLGGNTKADTKENALGYDEDSYGFTAGIMKKAGDKTSVGGFVGYLNSDVDYRDDSKSSQTTDTWTIKGAVEQIITDKLTWTSTLGYNISSTDTSRKITYDNTNREVNGDFDSWSVNAKTQLKYTYDITDRINLRPMAGISMDYLSQDGYTEKGNGYSMDVKAADAFSVRPEIGLESEMTVFNNNTSSFKVIPKVKYSYEVGNPYKDRDINLAGFSDAVSVDSRETGKNDLNLGLGIEYGFKDKIKLYGEYNKGIADGNDNQVIRAGFKIAW